MSSIDERLTEQFRRWAFRGQGMELWDAPVSPEPAFELFRGYDLSEEVPDDGRRPTLLSALFRRIFSSPGHAMPPEPETEPMPRTLVRGKLSEIQILTPPDQGFSREAYHYFFSSLSVCREPLAFELISTENGIAMQMAVHSMDVPLIREQFSVFFPECVLVIKENTLRQAWDKIEGECFAAVEFGLEKEFMLPLRSVKLDPYLGIIGALGELREGELCLFQVIFEPVRHTWADHALRSVSDASGAPFFVNAPELLSGAEQKTAFPLYAAVLRVVVRSGTSQRVDEIVGNVAGALRVFDNLEGNRLAPVENGEYCGDDHIEDAMSRMSRRSGMILSADELVGLVHLPSADVCSAKLIRNDLKTREAPSLVLSGNGANLGLNVHAGITNPVFLTPDQRLRHMFVIGSSGTGKSTLLFNLIKQDIESGHGVAVLDPHGDLVDHVLGTIPEDRIKDVVLLDPSDLEYPVGFNILHAHSELEKTLLASDLVSVFQRLSTSWGDQMGSVLSHGVMAFLESDRGGSLLDLRRFFLEPEFRKEYLKSVRDPEIVYYWEKGFPYLTGNKSIGPILTRLETFLTPKSIRHMVGQRENSLNFADVLDSGKIFLAKLSQGAIGKENSYLLGTLLVSKFQQLAMARQAQAEKNRRDFFLFVDEFHNFITPSMAEILAGARKYRLGLILANQELRQLERDREVASAVMSNVYSRICFRVGDQDARALESGFSHFGAKDLLNLGTGEAICRIERSDYDFNLTIPRPELPTEYDAANRRREVIDASRKAYGRSRAHVEIALGLVRQAKEQIAEPLPVERIAPRPQEQVPPVVLPPVIRKPVQAAPPTPGRGGREHKYLQTFIKQWAEGMGWRTTIEAPVPGGTGSVDVLLSKGEHSIACEISVTTSIEHEIGNLRKCLAAGFTYVVSISAEEKRTNEIEAAAKKVLKKQELARTRFYISQQLFRFVEELSAKHAATEKTVRGYKVKVSYRPLDQAERGAKLGSVAGVIAKSLSRMRPKKPEK